ncbi:hypothetical protein NC651_034392 [Populus alba x Populus x berolinensis]|nr:hypothetical protein NC651_034392 [Populus alba x Populus x berolinensis]
MYEQAGKGTELLQWGIMHLARDHGDLVGQKHSCCLSEEDYW